MPTFSESWRRISAQAGPLILIAGLLFAAAGGWLHLQARPELASESRLRTERVQIDARLVGVQQRIDQLAAEIPVEQDRAERAAKVVADLKALQSTWDRLVGNREQQRLNGERISRMESMHATASARSLELQQELARTKWDRDQQEIARNRIDSELQRLEAAKSEPMYAVRQFWLRSRSWLLWGIAAFLLGPLVVSWVRRKWQRAMPDDPAESAPL